MPYYTKDPERDHNFDNHSYAIEVNGSLDPRLELSSRKLAEAFALETLSLLQSNVGT